MWICFFQSMQWPYRKLEGFARFASILGREVSFDGEIER